MMAGNVVGEPQPAQLVDNNRKSYTIHFKRRVLLRLEETGNISAVSLVWLGKIFKDGIKNQTCSWKLL